MVEDQVRGTMQEPRGGRVTNGERLECLACRHTVPMYCSTNKSGLLPNRGQDKTRHGEGN